MYLDIFLIAVMLVSGMLAMVRGLIREVLSIAGWAAAAGAALYAYAKLLPAAKAYFNNDYVAIGVTTAGAFLGTLIVISVITVRISDKILDSRIGALDRTLGFLFTGARPAHRRGGVHLLRLAGAGEIPARGHPQRPLPRGVAEYR
jgi:membrane protein required for colicin V production